MDKLKYFVVLDFEATCIKNGTPVPQEIIEFPSVIVDIEKRKVISEFQEYIKPIFHPILSSFCTELTGITQKVVDEGSSFENAIENYKKWLGDNNCIDDNFVIVTCGNWDLGTIFPEQCSISNVPHGPPFDKWLNMKTLFCKVFKVPRSGGMAKMLEQRNLKLLGRHHSGIDDCRNSARLMVDMIENGLMEKSMKMKNTKSPTQRN